MTLISGIKLADGSYMLKPSTVKLVGLCFHSDPLLSKGNSFQAEPIFILYPIVYKLVNN